MDKTFWLDNYLARLKKSDKSNEQAVSSKDEFKTQVDEQIETDSEDLKKFEDELKSIMKLQNAGLNARAANNSIKTCLIS